LFSTRASTNTKLEETRITGMSVAGVADCCPGSEHAPHAIHKQNAEKSVHETSGEVMRRCGEHCKREADVGRSERRKLPRTVFGFDRACTLIMVENTAERKLASNAERIGLELPCRRDSF